MIKEYIRRRGWTTGLWESSGVWAGETAKEPPGRAQLTWQEPQEGNKDESRTKQGQGFQELEIRFSVLCSQSWSQQCSEDPCLPLVKPVDARSPQLPRLSLNWGVSCLSLWSCWDYRSVPAGAAGFSNHEHIQDPGKPSDESEVTEQLYILAQGF